MANLIKLRIAEVIIQFKSRIPVKPLTTENGWRFMPFIYEGKKKPDIELEVIIQSSLPPSLKMENRLFLSQHPSDNSRCWAMFKSKNNYLIKSYLKGKRQHIILNPSFNKGRAYLYTRKTRIESWPLDIIIYDALQIILSNYLIRHQGFFLHSVAIKDVDNKGLIFIGKSGAGKTTLARIWHNYSKAKVLNDDRIIIRKIKKDFYLYGTPWHGDFNDYLHSLPDRADLNKLFFIFHSKKNIAQDLREKELYAYIYPNIFFTFWDRSGLIRAIDLSKGLARHVPACRLGFKDNKDIIGFIRKNTGID